MCARSSLAVCSAHNSRPLIPLVELICASLWPAPFSVPTTCPQPVGCAVIVGCWSHWPQLIASVLICWALHSAILSAFIVVSKRQLWVAIGGSFLPALHQLHFNCSPFSPPSLPPRLLRGICGLQTLWEYFVIKAQLCPG